MAIYLIAGALLAWVVGLVVYVHADDGKEKPEPVETDVEHNPVTGAKLSKRNPLYWATVIAEALWSYPAAAIRKRLGLPQK